MRDYFTKGFYPSLYPNEKDSMDPTAALIKAALVNSAVSLNQSFLRNNHWGYGIPNLEKAMGFADNGVIYVDNVTIKPNGGHTYKVVVEEDGGDLAVSLSFTDIPHMYQVSRVLTNTINLVVEDMSAENVYPGNDNKDYDEMYSSLSKVLIRNATKGEYKIYVTC